MEIRAKFKLLFFDKEIVARSVGVARVKVLSRIGAFVRQRARSLIRKRKSVAKSGSPPSSHVGTLRALIFFGYDLRTQSVVIGPVRFGAGEAPNLLEFGGDITRTRNGQAVHEHYRGNPFMGPSLALELEAIPEQWANSVKSN